MGNSNNIQQEGMLPVGTILRGTYRIEDYLSSGGFGNTYVVTNIEFNERYAVKEFFMRGVNQRDEGQTTVTVSNTANRTSFEEQREKFKKEARRLRQLSNSHVVCVHDLFDENGTSYYVMDFIDGESLSDRLKRTGQPISETEVRNYLLQILDGLEEIHNKGFQHLDLKPANIMLDKQGNITIIDFGASKQMRPDGGATASTAICYTPGYAPREQMEQNYEKFGPWTDLYALGATLYNILTTNKPPMPSDIDDEGDAAFSFPSSVSDEMRSYIIGLMQPNRTKRPQKVMKPTWKANEETMVAEKEAKPLNPSGAQGDETIVGGPVVEPQPKPIPTLEPIKTPQKSTKATTSQKDEGSDLSILWLILLFGVLAIFFAIGINNFWGDSKKRDQNMDPVTIEKVPHEYVDLGLPSKTLWATCNIGANNPEEYGDYYAWGAIGIDSVYGRMSYRFGGLDSLTKYCTHSRYGAVDNLVELELTDDVAYKQKGNNWRIPSKEQWEELLNKCDWDWVSVSNVKCLRVKSRFNSNSIILPIAGCVHGASVKLQGLECFYWSRTLLEDGPFCAYRLTCNQEQVWVDYSARYIGGSIRPVYLSK